MDLPALIKREHTRIARDFELMLDQMGQTHARRLARRVLGRIGGYLHAQEVALLPELARRNAGACAIARLQHSQIKRRVSDSVARCEAADQALGPALLKLQQELQRYRKREEEEFHALLLRLFTHDRLWSLGVEMLSGLMGLRGTEEPCDLSAPEADCRLQRRAARRGAPLWRRSDLHAIPVLHDAVPVDHLR